VFDRGPAVTFKIPSIPGVVMLPRVPLITVVDPQAAPVVELNDAPAAQPAMLIVVDTQAAPVVELNDAPAAQPATPLVVVVVVVVVVIMVEIAARDFAPK
jgi:hypothetical protein